MKSFLDKNLRNVILERNFCLADTPLLYGVVEIFVAGDRLRRVLDRLE